MNDNLTIRNVEAFEVTVPIEAPLRHSYGVHEAFTRTIVRVTTSSGLVGLAETAASAAEVLQAGASVVGVGAAETGVLRARISQRFYWSTNPLVASAIEMACLDIVARALDVPAYRLLGGSVRESVAVAAYCFYRYSSEGHGAVATPEAMAVHAAELVERYGFETIKLKGGVLDPDTELETLRQIRAALPQVRLRIDPNAAWSVTTALRLLPELEAVGLEYLEDPVEGQAGMSRLRARSRVPLSTNMCVTDFAGFPGALELGSVDIVLSDPWYWGGPTQTQHLAKLCAIHGLGLGMHSGIELGIGMAVMAHVGVTIPSLTAAVDAHYHHLTDDVIRGARPLPVAGRVRPPEGPGWGVELDEDKVAQYRELHASGRFTNLYVTGDSGLGADRFRPDWAPVMPAW